jgi:predicted RNase H-like HicB family nuclease
MARRIAGYFETRLEHWLSLRHYNEVEARMEIVTLESIPIVVGREDDGRWWADIESMPGVMAYGGTRESAVAAVRALALRVAADCIDHGEEVPEPFAKVFSVA